MKTYLNIWKKCVKIRITYINGKIYEGYIEAFDDLGLVTRIENPEEFFETAEFPKKTNHPTMHPWSAIQSITFIR